MIHLASDLLTISNGATTLLTKILGSVFILFLGFKMLHHVALGHPGAAIGLALVALIPAIFIFDPQGATGFLKATIHMIGGTVYFPGL